MNRKDAWTAPAILAFSLALFSRAVGYDFVNFDDGDYVYNNPLVLQGVSVDGIRTASTALISAHWHPLTLLSYMLDAQVFGVEPWGFHLSNILLHALNGALLFLVLRMMTGERLLSAAVALLFTAHPLQVEPVAWISSRKDLLSAFFWLTAIGAYVWYAREERILRFPLVIIALILGLLSKSILMTAPFLFLLLDFWPLRRFGLTDLCAGPGWKKVGRLLAEKFILLCVVIPFLAANIVAQGSGGNINTLEETSAGSRLANVAMGYGGFLADVVWPSGLAAYYPRPANGYAEAPLLAAVAVIAFLTVGACFAGRRYPPVFVGWFWFVGTLVPVIGLVQLGAQARTDRYAYFPVIGLFIALVWGVSRFVPNRKVASIAAAALVASLSAASSIQLGHWRNSEALFQHTLAVTEANYLAHYNLAEHLSGQGRFNEAMEQYGLALAILPYHAESHINLGALLAESGNFAEAKIHFEAALATQPRNVPALSNMAMVLLDLGRSEDALGYAQRALEIGPAFERAQKALRLIGEVADSGYAP
jgi:tetratricopeptide (TPR) repeat protein